MWQNDVPHYDSSYNTVVASVPLLTSVHLFALRAIQALMESNNRLGQTILYSPKIRSIVASCFIKIYIGWHHTADTFWVNLDLAENGADYVSLDDVQSIAYVPL